MNENERDFHLPNDCERLCRSPAPKRNKMEQNGHLKTHTTAPHPERRATFSPSGEAKTPKYLRGEPRLAQRPNPPTSPGKKIHPNTHRHLDTLAS
jgi:hypothetical protein